MQGRHAPGSANTSFAGRAAAAECPQQQHDLRPVPAQARHTACLPAQLPAGTHIIRLVLPAVLLPLPLQPGSLLVGGGARQPLNPLSLPPAPGGAGVAAEATVSLLRSGMGFPCVHVYLPTSTSGLWPHGGQARCGSQPTAALAQSPGCILCLPLLPLLGFSYLQGRRRAARYSWECQRRAQAAGQSWRGAGSSWAKPASSPARQPQPDPKPMPQPQPAAKPAGPVAPPQPQPQPQPHLVRRHAFVPLAQEGHQLAYCLVVLPPRSLARLLVLGVHCTPHLRGGGRRWAGGRRAGWWVGGRQGGRQVQQQ